MDLRVTFVVVCLCALAITSSEAGIPRCCYKTVPNISKRLQRKVYKVEIQQNTGACDISAVVVYIKGKNMPICVDPMVLMTKDAGRFGRKKQ